MQGLIEFFKKLFSESGDVSMSRFGFFIALIASCAWATFALIKTGVIPDLTGVTVFCGTFYGIGKVNETVQSFSGKSDDAPKS